MHMVVVFVTKCITILKLLAADSHMILKQIFTTLHTMSFLDNSSNILPTTDNSTGRMTETYQAS